MIRLGTRGSKLALAQAQLVAQRLRQLGADIELVTIITAGDRAISAPPDSGATGIFVKEIESALLDRAIDLAVHSLKDMTTMLPQGLSIGAVLARDSPYDALICREGALGIDDLPEGTRVGTSSPRRRAQLLHYRPDLQVLPLRGNVNTRLRRLEAGHFDAIVLAHAGLQRLGLDDTRATVIPPDVCLPAPGQGALAVEMRGDDGHIASFVSPLEDAATRAAVTGERAFLRALGGGCRAAVGALGRVEGESLRLQGAVTSADGAVLLQGESEGRLDDAEQVGMTLAQELKDAGASALIAGAWDLKPRVRDGGCHES